MTTKLPESLEVGALVVLLVLVGAVVELVGLVLVGASSVVELVVVELVVVVLVVAVVLDSLLTGPQPDASAANITATAGRALCIIVAAYHTRRRGASRRTRGVA
jgi:hypothetical protein